MAIAEVEKAQANNPALNNRISVGFRLNILQFGRASRESTPMRFYLHPAGEDHPVYNTNSLLERKKAKCAARAKQQLATKEVEAEGTRRSELLKAAAQKLGSFVSLTLVNEEIIEGNLTHILDGVTKLPVPEHQVSESVKLPHVVIMAPEAEQPHELAIGQISSINVQVAESHTLVRLDDYR